MKQDARVGGQTPVVMLAASIDTIEWFLVQKHPETMFMSHLFHQSHQEHIMVNGKVTLLKNRRQLKLTGGHFVMSCLAGNAEFECLSLQIFHESLHSFGDSTEVMVVHLLVLGRVVAH